MPSRGSESVARPTSSLPRTRLPTSRRLRDTPGPQTTDRRLSRSKRRSGQIHPTAARQATTGKVSLPSAPAPQLAPFPCLANQVRRARHSSTPGMRRPREMSTIRTRPASDSPKVGSNTGSFSHGERSQARPPHPPSVFLGAQTSTMVEKTSSRWPRCPALAPWRVSRGSSRLDRTSRSDLPPPRLR